MTFSMLATIWCETSLGDEFMLRRECCEKWCETQMETPGAWESRRRQPRQKTEKEKPFRITRNGIFNVPVATDYASNDFPQPQLCRAFGLEILNPPPVSASEKSTTEPRR